jgi:uncharacterized protein involved in exopolysaccharide biosynthesis
METPTAAATTGNIPRTLPIAPFDSPRFDWFSMALAAVSHKWIVCGAALAGAAIAGFVAFRTPNEYTATAVILPPAQQRPGFAAMLGQISPLGASAAGGDLLRSPADLYLSLLGCRTVSDGIVGDLKLERYYGVKTLTAARDRLAARTKLSSGKDTLIRIAVRDANPAHAALVANAYIDKLYQLNSRLAVTESSQRRVFFERQMETEKEELAAAETAMKRIQESTGLVQVNSQVEAVIRSIAQLQAEITSREALLEGLASGATEQNPEVVRVRAEIDSLRGRLGSLENSAQTGESETMPAASRVPGAGLEYLRALRQLKYHESLVEVLAKQYESAKIDEAKQATVVQVVDYAVAPELKSGPRRMLLILFGGASQAALALMLIMLRVGMSKPERAARARLLLRALLNRRERECPA